MINHSFHNRQNLNISSLIDGIKKHNPEVWKETEPKVYKNADQWHDYRFPFLTFAGALAFWKFNQNQTIVKDDEMRENMISVLIHKKYNFPLFFLSRELFLAAFHTDCLPEVDWKKLTMPFPAMTFVLPKNSLSVNGEQILYITVTKAKKGDYRDSDLNTPIILANDALFFRAFTDTGVTFTRTQAEIYYRGNPLKVRTDNSYQTAIDEQELGFLEKVIELSFNIIFAMISRPEFIGSGKKIGFHKKQKTEIWSPNILGAKYIYKRAASSDNSNFKRRLHWRRGHFRNQRIGIGLTESKIIWIEPMIVGETN